MTTLWTAEAAAAATGGVITGARDWRASGVAIDSRALTPGDLFVALEGDNADGHAYLADAFEAGAAAALVARVMTSPKGPQLHVKDTLRGLEALAAQARARSAARIVAVTGSVGKTSVKEALAHALSAQAPTHAAAASYNNHWGLPLTLARMPAESRYGVLEIGMNHAGEITPLSRLARPHVALVTTVAAAHLAHFPSEEAIADAKAEIFLGLEPGGVAILNRDNRHFERLARAAREAGAKVVSFGLSDEADIRGRDVALAAEHSTMKVAIEGDSLALRVGAPGAHWAVNALGVIAAARALGADVEAAARALADVKPPRGRGARARVEAPGGAFTVIDESYNANPASMGAALALLGQARPGVHGRRIAVLGDMLELGPQSAALHQGLVKEAMAAKVDLIFACGPDMAALFEAAPAAVRGAYAPDSTALCGAVVAAVKAGDVVMVKGSLGSRMAPIVEALLARGAPPRPAVAGQGG